MRAIYMYVYKYFTLCICIYVLKYVRMCWCLMPHITSHLNAMLLSTVRDAIFVLLFGEREVKGKRIVQSTTDAVFG